MASTETGVRLVQSKYQGSSRRLWWTSIYAYLGALCFGYVIGYTSPAIPSMIIDSVLFNSNAGWFGSLLTVGAILGGPIGGICIGKIGRVLTIRFAAATFILGWLPMLISSKLAFLYLGRFISGFGSGLVTVCVPVYVSEIATKDLRGILGSGTQLFITLGILLAYSVGVFANWYQMVIIGLVPSVLALLVTFLLPETPRYLLSKNRKADALKSLQCLRDPHMDVHEECKDIDDGFGIQESFSWWEFISKPELSRPLFISLIIFIFQQFSGINAMMFYTVSIFQSTIPHIAHTATVAVGLVQVIGTMVACLLMDRVGRRKLLIVAGLIMCINLFAFGLYHKYVEADTLSFEARIWWPISCLTLFILGFSLGWGPIPVLVMSEIFPLRARGPASSIAILGNWLCAFIITNEFLTMQKTFGEGGVFYFFSFCCLLSVIFVFKFLPETKGKSLEDIELYFLGKSVN